MQNLKVKTQSFQAVCHSALSQRTKPANAESVFWPGSTQLDRLPVTSLNGVSDFVCARVRLSMFVLGDVFCFILFLFVF